MKRTPLSRQAVRSAVGFLLSFTCCAQTFPNDPNNTSRALRALMKAGSAVIPLSSTCNGYYFTNGRATVTDMLALQFGYLYNGKNTVAGGCKGRDCKIEILHANGEDVSAALISFQVVKGVAQVSTLQCVMTP